MTGGLKKRGNNSGYSGLNRLSVEEIIKQSDAVLIESDVWNLNGYAKMCIDAGKHIHMDKPGGYDHQEYINLIRAMEDKKLIMFIQK